MSKVLKHLSPVNFLPCSYRCGFILAASLSLALNAVPSARAETESPREGPPAAEYLKEVGASSSRGIALTIYNQNFGLVKDVRMVQLKSGINHLRFEDVAAAIDPTTVSFTSITAPNTVVVREQNYQYDVMDADTILSKSVGKEITLRQYLDGGRINELHGTLINSPRVTIVDTNGNAQERHLDLVVKTDHGVVLRPTGEIEIAKLPEGLVAKPSLLWKLESTRAGEHKTEISYQTAGLNWRCDYVAVVNDDDTATDLTSWVTIDNKSGATYKDSSLKLIAGDVHKITEQRPVPQMAMYKAAAAPAMDNQFSERSFAEYHLYTLAGTTNLNNNETKQLSLFNASNVPARKLFIYDPSGRSYYYGWAPQNGPQKVNVKIEIANTEKNNLGMALPKGKVRVYKKDQDGSLQLIGEDAIDHTPRDEKIRLYIGDAFDLVGEYKQITHEQPSAHLSRDTYEISLRNHKDKKVTITAVMHAWGDWKIKESSQDYKKKDAHTFEFDADVPARDEVKITYTIETKY